MTMPDNAESPIEFRPYTSPTGSEYLLPSDVELRLPSESSLPPESMQRLVYIPWDDKYLDNVPGEYQEIFKGILPELGVRTTDVHIAVCTPYVKKLGDTMVKLFNHRAVYLGFMLHDIGWNQLTDEEVASSLGVAGLQLNEGAVGPKQKHAVLGSQRAAEILEEISLDPPLSADEKELIVGAVRYHDEPWKLSESDDIPLEMQIVCDVDHLWSFTHLNFWQDTVRKGVEPEVYISNLERDLDGYFVTEQGKKMAHDMLKERRAEVEAMQLSASG
ncbi:MAG: HD domain-containing protein [Candidatus Saccharimonadales bacterium]